jgi:hypothetical protein
MVLVMLALAIFRPVIAFPSRKPCEGFGKVACAGDPANAWVNSNLTGPSLPPAGTSIYRVKSKDWGAKLDYKCITQLSFSRFIKPLVVQFTTLLVMIGWCVHSASTSMEHSNGMLQLHNFNEDFTFALDSVNSECSGVYQVNPHTQIFKTFLSQRFQPRLFLRPFFVS